MTATGKVNRLVQVVATTQLEAARTRAAELGGYVLEDTREPFDHLPFRSLMIVATDETEQLEELADVGMYLCAERVIKAGPIGVAGLFPMIHKAGLTRSQADGHWRDNHAPLALKHHQAMTSYTQLSVQSQLSGREFNGFAICAFANEEDLRERFFSLPDSVKLIGEDVARFADTRKSARRLIVRRA